MPQRARKAMPPVTINRRAERTREVIQVRILNGIVWWVLEKMVRSIKEGDDGDGK